MNRIEFLVIGAGISGASAAYELAAEHSVCLIEAEDQPGYHSTGRSAALYTPNFGTPLVRKINAASFPFFQNPPDGFCDLPVLAPRGALILAKPGEETLLAKKIAQSSPDRPIRPITPAEALTQAPLMRPETVAAAALEEGVFDMDVDALHRAYLRGFKRRGGALHCGARLTALVRRKDAWVATAGHETILARVLINASGAWGDEVAGLAGAPPQGVTPMRRTAIAVELPPPFSGLPLPLIEYVNENPYLKPETGAIVVSLGDETPTPAQDAQPEELDIALLVDWLETHTSLRVKRAPRAWAGLRNFTPDRAPVVGFDPEVEDFFWLVGQGGYGIMMAPSLARITAALVTGKPIPADLMAAGIEAKALRAGRG